MNRSQLARFVENVKVFIRKHALLNIVARIVYLPVLLYRYARIEIVALKDTNKAIKNINAIGNKKKLIFYLGIPIDKNLGDAAQYVCIIDWLNANYPGFHIVEIKTAPFCKKNVRNRIKKVINSDCIFFVQSGETFDDRHPDHTMHRILLKEFYKYKVVFLPQTVYFTSEDEMNITKQCTQKSNNVVFLARDPKSYEIANKNLLFKHCYLFPDIVTSLIGEIKISNEERRGVVFCKRIDGEKILFDADLRPIIGSLANKYGFADVTDTDFYCSYDETYSDPRKYVLQKIEELSKYRLVITDRFHGMIFSLIANTPCIVLPTHGHKVISGEEMLEKVYSRQSLRMVSNIKDIESNAAEMYGYQCDNNNYCNQTYYKELKGIIDKCI